MTQFRSIKVKGIFAGMAKSGKSARLSISDKDALDTLFNDALQKRPTWKRDYSDNEREFYIGKGGIFEMWDDNEDVPPDFDNTKTDGDDNDCPF